MLASCVFVNCKLIPRCVQTAFLKDYLFSGNDCRSDNKAGQLYYSTGLLFLFHFYTKESYTDHPHSMFIKSCEIGVGKGWTMLQN